MRIVSMAALAAPVLLFLSAGSAAAGCSGNGCYQHVVTPPVYGTQLQTVQVAPARVVSHVSPARYGVVDETVMVRPEQRIGRVIPAQVGSVAETVMIAPASRRWEVSTDAWGRTVGCWVDVPAQYTTRYRQVVTRPSMVVEERAPAVYAMQQRTVMVHPGKVHQRVIPPVYGTVAHKVQVAPATASWRPLY